MRVLWWVVVVAACVPPQQQYTYKPNTDDGEEEAAEEELPSVEARVVSAQEAEESGLPGRQVVIPFTKGSDGTELTARFFQNANLMHAHLISELAIVLESTQDGRRVECRTEIVPESITDTQVRPGHHKTVPVSRPVQRTVTEQQYKCKPVMKHEMRSHTEQQQKCGSVSRPVHRTRTVYRSQYDSFSKSTRSVPHTEHYTAYESHFECKSEPVTRLRSEMVHKNECGFETVTRTVTRYEFQLESTYVPPQMELVTRQRLRELEPVCYDLEGSADDPSLSPPSDTRPTGNRIEGKIFSKH